MIGVYEILNKRNQMSYVGGTTNLSTRYLLHLSQLRRNKHSNKRMQKDYNIYGADNFVYRQLEICTKKKLIEREQFYLNKVFEKGLNYNKIKKATSKCFPNKCILSKKVVKLLAGHWDKTELTIKHWVKKSNPMLTHPESLKIINNKTHLKKRYGYKK